MGNKVVKLNTSAGPCYWFYCQGCKSGHAFDKRWTFNGDLEKPTFHPSLLVNQKSIVPNGVQCHSFVRNGRIQYLNDCDHDLKGTTVDLLDDVVFGEPDL